MTAHSISSSFAHSSAAVASRPSFRRYAPARSTTLSSKLQKTLKQAFHAFMDRRNSERFYQDHVAAIYAAIYTEIATGAALGTLGIYLFTR